MTPSSKREPKRPEVLTLWGRLPIPADMESGDTERRERLVKVVAEAMARPVRPARDWQKGFRRVAIFAVAASLVLLAVGTGLARTAGRWLAARFEPPPTTSTGDRGASSVLVLPGGGQAGTRSPPGCVSAPPNAGNAVAGTAEASGGSRVPSSPKRLLAQAPPAASPSALVDLSAERIEPASPANDLAQQNRVFADAMMARRRGDAVEALRYLDLLIREYPRSLLAQDAYVERFRVLAETGDSEAAAQAARAYLTRFPHGFAHQEASGIAAGR